MQFNKISSHPPQKKSIEEFIQEANEKKRDTSNKTQPQRVTQYPWDDPMLRGDVQKVFSVKLPEEYILKIKYVSERTNKSQQKIVREIICEEIEKLISQFK